MRVEVSKDEEGNGGGFMLISEYKSNVLLMEEGDADASS